MKDKIIERLIEQERRRQGETLNLIASENIVSDAVQAALGSVFTNKYAEGYPGRRYYGGQAYVDRVELLAQERALRLFKLSPQKWSSNVQPYSGSPANLAIYTALIPIGGRIMGMQLDMGGHLTHGHRVSASGKFWEQVPYGVDETTELLDYGALRRVARRKKPHLIVAGYTAYPRRINFKKFREIADDVGAILMVDMSHIAGLVAAGVHPSPFRWADIVMTTTHKTLRGPRGAIIFSRKEYAVKINRAVFPGIQGGPHVNQIAATAVALHEADSASFRRYTKQVVQNARTIAEELKRYGWRIVSGGTDTHLLLVDVAEHNISGKEAEEALERVGMIVNKNTIPYDERPPMDPSGIRIGTPTVTTRGMKQREMSIIAELICRTLRQEVSPQQIKKEVKKLCKKFPL